MRKSRSRDLTTAPAIMSLLHILCCMVLIFGVQSYEVHHVHLPDHSQSLKTVSEYELIQSRRALLLLKDRLGGNISNLLQSDIDDANIMWHRILANSSNNPPIPATAKVEALVSPKVMNATAFIAWFNTDTGDPHKESGANPGHYSTILTVSDNITTVHNLESWGDLLTQYTIPNYGPGPKQPYMEDLPEFPFQFVGPVILLDGTVIAHVHNSFRDLPGGRGIEAVLNVWLPDGVADSVVEDLREHQAVEFSNWFKFCYRDIVQGKFP